MPQDGNDLVRYQGEYHMRVDTIAYACSANLCFGGGRALAVLTHRTLATSYCGRNLALGASCCCEKDVELLWCLAAQDWLSA